MNNYFLKDGTREKGPFLVDDLKYQRIRPDTLVKIDDGKWQPISEVRDLRFLLNEKDGSNAYSSASVSSDSPLNRMSANTGMTTEEINKKKTSVIMLAVVILMLAMGMAVFFFNAGR